MQNAVPLCTSGFALGRPRQLQCSTLSRRPTILQRRKKGYPRLLLPQAAAVSETEEMLPTVHHRHLAVLCPETSDEIVCVCAALLDGEYILT